MSLPEFCTEFFDLMDEYPDEFDWQIWALRKRVEKAFATENLIVYEDRYENYIGLGERIGVGRGFPWERFVLGCMLCTYLPDGRPRWDFYFQCSGRGAGKDIVIEWGALCLISPYNPVRDYDVDIFGYVEDQATRPVKDLTQKVFKTDPGFYKQFFKWTKEKITGLDNGGTIWGHANNPKAGDGLRSGAVIYNEVHAYENQEQIEVGTSGLGKVPEGRQFYLTTNGNISEGPFDNFMAEAENLLSDPEKDDDRKFFFIWKLDDKSEADDERMWNKANPSLRYFPDLLDAHRRDYKKWKENPRASSVFMTKRMNIRQSNQAMPVTERENLVATNRPIPYEKLRGSECIAGVDYAMLNDWAAANLHFLLDDGTRVDINHAWICKESKDLWRLKCPYKDWANMGLVTIVEEPQISPQLIVDWILDQAHDLEAYVRCVCIDNYRYELMARALGEAGFSKAYGNLVLYRPREIMRVAPLITSIFDEQKFIWGDNPCLRWGTNNTKLVPAKGYKLAAGEEVETGNFVYGKIERHARKTDPFFALVASMTEERQLLPAVDSDDAPFECWTF